MVCRYLHGGLMQELHFLARSNVWQDVGDMNAKFRGGWDNTFNYKSFSLNVLIDAKIGGDFALMTYRQGTHSGVFPNSIFGRDAQSGGITWTSKYDQKHMMTEVS